MNEVSVSLLFSSVRTVVFVFVGLSVATAGESVGGDDTDDDAAVVAAASSTIGSSVGGDTTASSNDDDCAAASSTTIGSLCCDNSDDAISCVCVPSYVRSFDCLLFLSDLSALV